MRRSCLLPPGAVCGRKPDTVFSSMSGRYKVFHKRYSSPQTSLPGIVTTFARGGLLAWHNNRATLVLLLFVSSNQDFMLQGDRVTFQSVLKRFYFHGYYKYSRYATRLSNSFFFFFLSEAKLGKYGSDEVLRILFRIRKQMTFLQWYDYLTSALVHEAALLAGETSLTGWEHWAVSHNFPIGFCFLCWHSHIRNRGIFILPLNGVSKCNSRPLQTVMQRFLRLWAGYTSH